MIKIIAAAVALVVATTAPTTQSVVQRERFARTITKQVGYNYVVRVPRDSSAKGKLPLIIFLHGSGECGDDLSKVENNALLKSAPANDPSFPFMVVAPQLPTQKEWWSPESLDALLDHVLDQYPVDPDRVYLTGISLGGYGVWDWSCHRPDGFAAIAPIAGEGNDDWAGELRHVPVWAFHGAKDKAVSPAEEERMVDAVNREGGEAKLSVYPDAGHNAWTRAYNDPELYRWVLAHPRRH